MGADSGLVDSKDMGRYASWNDMSILEGVVYTVYTSPKLEFGQHFVILRNAVQQANETGNSL